MIIITLACLLQLQLHVYYSCMFNLNRSIRERTTEFTTANVLGPSLVLLLDANNFN